MANIRLTGIIIAILASAGCGGGAQDDRAPRSIACVTPVDDRYAPLPAPQISESLILSGSFFSSGVAMTGLDLESLGAVTITGKSSLRARKDGIQIGIGGGGVDIEIAPSESDSCILVFDPEAPDFVYILSDGLPDYDTSGFPNSESPSAVIGNQRLFRIPSTPAPAEQITELSANSFDGVLLNGVLVQLRETDCAGADCGLPHNANPMHAPAMYGMDEHHAHTLSDGTYHYHGDPQDLYNDDGTLSGIIGLAADGYPIFGPWFDDDGVIREATSSYQLKSGSVMTEAGEYFYNGTYAEDYEYVAASGDLDECNGMEIGGQYGYYVTDTFPYIMNCLRGTPDSSFGFPNP